MSKLVNGFRAVSFKPRVFLIPDSHVPPFYTSYALIYERYASVVCGNSAFGNLHFHVKSDVLVLKLCIVEN
jgi:hypothetical protein